ncbi:hypothetical protein ABK040_016220 [Willaertia magna]
MGGHRMNYPKDVWVSAGYYTNNSRAVRNIFLALSLSLLGAIPIFKISSTFERRYGKPIHPIPSEQWSKHKINE